MPLDGGQPDLFALLVVLFTLLSLALFCVISLIVTTIQVFKKNKLLSECRCFVQFILGLGLIVINLGILFAFLQFLQRKVDQGGKEFFGNSYGYTLFWIPFNIILVVGLAEIIYRSIARSKSRKYGI